MITLPERHQFILFALLAWICGRIYGVIWAYSGLPRPPLQIHRHKAFRLTLQTGVAHGRKPAFHLAIVFKPPIFLRLVAAFAHVVQDDP